MNRANSVKNAVKNCLDKAVKSKKHDKNQIRKNPKISPRIKSRPVRRETSDESKENVCNLNNRTPKASDKPHLKSFLGLNDFNERYVMNNYFGIGLDAKIVLDFHHYRDKNQKNCG